MAVNNIKLVVGEKATRTNLFLLRVTVTGRKIFSNWDFELFRIMAARGQ